MIANNVQILTTEKEETQDETHIIGVNNYTFSWNLHNYILVHLILYIV
jgi:hypothetical protein